MFGVSSKGVFAVLAVVLAGTLILSGCTPVTSAAAAAALAPQVQLTTVAPDATTAAATAPAVATAATGNEPTLAPATNAAAPAPASQPATTAGFSRTITVVGHGEVKSQPEVANSTIGIEVTAPTVADATKQAQARMDAVLKALKAAGIADKDIQTTNYSINFERQQPGGPVQSAPGTSSGGTDQAVPGVYHVNNMVNVTIRDLTKVGPVIDAAVNAGANNVWGINFGLDNTSALEAQARQKAIADAKARAESLAQLTGVKVGQVVSVSEVVGQQPRPMAASAVGMGGGGGTPVQPGELTFSTDIQVVYAIQ